MNARKRLPSCLPSFVLTACWAVCKLQTRDTSQIADCLQSVSSKNCSMSTLPSLPLTYQDLTLRNLQFTLQIFLGTQKHSEKTTLVQLHFGAKPSARLSRFWACVGGRISSFIMAHAPRAREDFSLMQEKLNVLFPGRQHQIQQLLHLIGKVSLFHF